MKRWWFACAGLVLSCGTQEQAISEMVQVHIQTPVPVVAQAQQRAMVDFMIPPRMLPQGATTARWEQCLYDKEDVRRYFPPRLAVVEIAPDMIRISGHRVVALDEYSPLPADQRGLLLLPLFEAASAMADDAKSAGAMGGCWPDFGGQVLIAQHPDAPFSIQRSVMYTLAQAQFGDISFLVSVAESGAGAAAQHPPINAHSIVSVRSSTLPAIGPLEMIGPG
jgi:hypothetical protein